MHSTQFPIYWPDTNPPHRIPDSDSSLLLLVLVVAAITIFGNPKHK